MSKLTPDTVEELLAALVKGGGTAFPVRMETIGAEFHGMTLRDYFAAKVLAATLASDTAVSEIMASMLDGDAAALQKRCAGIAYEFADAMLAERSK